MRVSKIVEDLTRIMAHHGDVEVEVFNDSSREVYQPTEVYPSNSNGYVTVTIEV